jgi:hypothetical protein
LDRPDEVLGELAGVVRNTHLRDAIRIVFEAGKTSTNPTGVREMLTLKITPT